MFIIEHKPGMGIDVVNAGFLPPVIGALPAAVKLVKISNSPVAMFNDVMWTSFPLSISQHSFVLLAEKVKSAHPKRYPAGIVNQLLQGRRFVFERIADHAAFWMHIAFKKPVGFWCKHIRLFLLATRSILIVIRDKVFLFNKLNETEKDKF